ncbi:MAG: hypothetical protein IJ561_01075, partial [Ruminococcus sp.]|nr:hypothetical protein [Ruminococcus sp.]
PPDPLPKTFNVFGEDTYVFLRGHQTYKLAVLLQGSQVSSPKNQKSLGGGLGEDLSSERSPPTDNEQRYDIRTEKKGGGGGWYKAFMGLGLMGRILIYFHHFRFVFPKHNSGPHNRLTLIYTTKVAVSAGG